MTGERGNLPSTPNEIVDAWVKAATEAERSWNQYFNQIMGSDAYAQMMARWGEAFAGAQAAFARSMEQYLRTLSIPTHSDLARLAERLTALEERVDALAAARDSGRAPRNAKQPRR